MLRAEEVSRQRMRLLGGSVIVLLGGFVLVGLLQRFVLSPPSDGQTSAPDLAAIQSPETYVGYERQENYASPQSLAKDKVGSYSAPTQPTLNQWALAGQWVVGSEHATSTGAGGKIVFRFHARDLHLVLAPPADGKAIRFRVTIDGAAPGQDRGVDVDTSGNGVVTQSRLYQLVRQKNAAEDRTFEIEFLDPGVQAFAFTFG